jgi:uncharacterized protein YrrD
MQLVKNAEMLTADGDTIGRIERVMLNPDTQKVTHYVVRKGLLFSAEKVVPVNKIQSSPGGPLHLREGQEAFEKFPNFEKPESMKREKIIPDGTVILKNGAEIISKDKEPVGSFEHFMIDPMENRAEFFVLKDGIFIQDQKVLPTEWISEVSADKVYLSVDSDTVENRPKFKRDYHT